MMTKESTMLRSYSFSLKKIQSLIGFVASVAAIILTPKKALQPSQTLRSYPSHASRNRPKDF